MILALSHRYKLKSYEEDMNYLCICYVNEDIETIYNTWPGYLAYLLIYDHKYKSSISLMLRNKRLFLRDSLQSCDPGRNFNITQCARPRLLVSEIVGIECLEK